jgi:hypothetical protein
VNVGFGGDFVDATARESFHLANLVKTATNLADVRVVFVLFMV